jgi:rubrerythrin
VENSALFDDITFEHTADGTVSGAFGRCMVCDAYQWLGFSALEGEAQVWCPTCNQREAVKA